MEDIELGIDRMATVYDQGRPWTRWVHGRPSTIGNLWKDYQPKLSNIRFDMGTPKLSSMFSTAFDMGPGPHM